MALQSFSLKKLHTSDMVQSTGESRLLYFGTEPPGLAQSSTLTHAEHVPSNMPNFLYDNVLSCF